MKNLIYYKWGSNSDDILIPKLVSMGYEVTVIDTKCSDYTRDMHLAQEFIFKINENHAEAVFSYDFFPILGMVCNTCNIPYYSWVYDSPHFTLYAKSAALECNHIGVFDHALVDRMQGLGIDTVYHAPLAVDTGVFADSIGRCRKDYGCDISFVGSLYTDEHEYYTLFRNGSTGYSGAEELWQILDDLTGQQTFDFDRGMIRDALAQTPELTDYLYSLMEQHGLTLGDDYIQDHEGLVYDAILAKHVTVLERRALMEALAAHSRERGYDFRLYTGSQVDAGSVLAYAIRRAGGPIDYMSQMPAVFNKSRININLTLRTIRTGIPLRALDVLACGGFLLTDPREELSDHMKPGEDYETFSSIEECLEKTDYYLEHEDLRQRIAASGHEKCREYYDLSKNIHEMLAD